MLGPWCLSKDKGGGSKHTFSKKQHRNQASHCWHLPSLENLHFPCTWLLQKENCLNKPTSNVINFKCRPDWHPAVTTGESSQETMCPSFHLSILPADNLFMFQWHWCRHLSLWSQSHGQSAHTSKTFILSCRKADYSLQARFFFFSFFDQVLPFSWALFLSTIYASGNRNKLVSALCQPRSFHD